MPKTNNPKTDSNYCPNCKQKVVPLRKISWGKIVIINLVFGAILYCVDIWSSMSRNTSGINIFIILCYVAFMLDEFFKRKQCPICGYKFEHTFVSRTFSS